MAEMSADERNDQRGLPIALPRAAAILAGMLLALVALYWFVLRTDYVRVFERLTENDAAAVVAELSERKIDHRLADGGTTILIAADQADRARLDIASSELPLRGQIGFELFNESDMGLTEFSQKINYQRALQGELARTIMLLDGIDNARVHLALPERALFRGARSEPTAAVTLILKPGRSITASRISGIQRLVAGAVPELDVGNVAILDDSGQLVSAMSEGPDDPGVAGEAQAVSLYHKARLTSAIASVAPDLDYTVAVLVKQNVEIGMPDGEASVAPLASTAASDRDPARSRRNYALEIEITTARTLAPAEQERLSAAVIESAELNQANGDRLVFRTGSTRPVAPAMAAQPITAIASREVPDADRRNNWSEPPLWLVVLPLALLAGAAAAWIVMRGSRTDEGKAAAIEKFADQLKIRLAAQGGPGRG